MCCAAEGTAVGVSTTTVKKKTNVACEHVVMKHGAKLSERNWYLPTKIAKARAVEREMVSHLEAVKRSVAALWF